ncbi:MAG: Isopentenyl-diphosphate Delta-isomerase [candidate division TM6 bacterium GW2011_GWF2_32_72]|nr:MAG: Isopentenyl-diphosphate Delta-isomerase [candidate division TM6 bacterium GW2011_GWF2_32_72]
MEQVVLVDELDNFLGNKEKLQTHIDGDLHRAVSVLIFNTQGQILLQQRAECKYHTPGLWANAACTHPKEDEDPMHAGVRRLQEEMGFACEIAKLFTFIYKAKLGKNLIEHEFDHVFVGTYDGSVVPNPEEVQAYVWIDMNDLLCDIGDNPEKYAPWFKIILEKLIELFEADELA